MLCPPLGPERGPFRALFPLLCGQKHDRAFLGLRGCSLQCPPSPAPPPGAASQAREGRPLCPVLLPAPHRPAWAPGPQGESAGQPSAARGGASGAAAHPPAVPPAGCRHPPPGIRGRGHCPPAACWHQRLPAARALATGGAAEHLAVAGGRQGAARTVSLPGAGRGGAGPREAPGKGGPPLRPWWEGLRIHCGAGFWRRGCPSSLTPSLRYITQATVLDLQRGSCSRFPCHAWLAPAKDGPSTPRGFWAAPPPHGMFW